MSWHCEDAAILYSQLPAVREKWHAIAAGLRAVDAKFLRARNREAHARLYESLLAEPAR